MIRHVPTGQIRAVWPEVEGLLRPVTDLPGCRCTLQGTYLKLRTGQRQLFVVVQEGTIVAAGVTCVTSYDAGDWFTVIMCGGKGFNEWGVDAARTMEAFAKERGCVGVEIIGREGWTKRFAPLGYERTATMIQKELH